jgi:hypothetical protein
MKPSRPSPFRSERGSLLIVSMIMCAIISISLVSYLRLGRTTMVTSNRALYNNAAMNLAENGLEEAMYALNKAVSDSSFVWTSNGWTACGSGNVNARRRLPSATGTYSFDQATTGYVRVYVYNYEGTGAAPKVVARSIVTLGGATQRTLEKWVYVQLRTTSKFANGLVAKNSLTFNGNNASVDSWDSHSDTTTTADDIKYSVGVRDDNGSIGSISVAVGAVGVNNADIWGYAATGAGLPSVGSNGLIGPFGTSTGTMDMSHVSSDFTASFDPVTAPTGGSAIAAIGTGDLPMTLGTAGVTQTISLPSIGSAGNSSKVLTIVGNVTLVLTNTAGSDAISMTGQSSISIAAGSSLKIYTAGNVEIAGNGITNGGTTAATANNPSNLQIWGTSTTSQNIKIAGNGTLSAIVYAPTATVTINGNGDVEGSVVANNITLTGNAAFHYDESLARFGGGNPYRVAAWRELTQYDVASSNDDRAYYTADLTWTD